MEHQEVLPNIENGSPFRLANRHSDLEPIRSSRQSDRKPLPRFQIDKNQPKLTRLAHHHARTTN